MRKFVFIIIIGIFLFPVFTEEYNFTQKDIDKFLSFADAYIKEAKRVVKGSEKLSIEELYYSESEKLMDVTETFLKKYDWDYLKLNDFLYIIRIAMDYIGLVDEYGDILGDEINDLGAEIPEAMMELVRKNMTALTKYFAPTDYGDFSDDPGSYEEGDNPDFDEEGAGPPDDVETGGNTSTISGT